LIAASTADHENHCWTISFPPYSWYNQYQLILISVDILFSGLYTERLTIYLKHLLGFTHILHL
jgi:hypothetical protein